MLQEIFDATGPLVSRLGHLDRTQWVMIFFGVLFLGLLCMKGLGSKGAI